MLWLKKEGTIIGIGIIIFFTRELIELEGISFCFVVLVLVKKSISQSKAILGTLALSPS
jgi:hypothetical protein